MDNEIGTTCSAPPSDRAV